MQTLHADELRLDAYEVSPERGFLPAEDPLPYLEDPYYAPWEQIAGDLPKLLVARKIRPVVEAMPRLSTERLQTDRERRRAMMLLSYIGHAYVWNGDAPAERIPANLAVPWYELSQQLGRPPVLSYASYALDNWRRLDPNAPIELGNIVLLQNFLAGLDEEWFILIHVDIEAKAARAIRQIPTAIRAAESGDLPTLTDALREVAAALEAMYAVLARMPEACDPYIYYHRVRPYIHGWKNNPALPNGVIYEGVEAYGGQPQQFRGETGAQSSIIPTLDGLLGIQHADDPLKTYLMEMRLYMPPAHRRFLEAVEARSRVREVVRASGDPPPRRLQRLRRRRPAVPRVALGVRGAVYLQAAGERRQEPDARRHGRHAVYEVPQEAPRRERRASAGVGYRGDCSRSRRASRSARRSSASSYLRRSSSVSGSTGGTGVGRPAWFSATYTKYACEVMRRSPVSGFSASTTASTSIEVRHARTIRARTCTRLPTCTGSRKLTESISTVTAGLRAWREATIPPASSMSFSTQPPCTFPSGFACSGFIIWVSTTSVSDGVRGSIGAQCTRLAQEFAVEVLLLAGGDAVGVVGVHVNRDFGGG
jgi:indoleamine 2,3-dioxygenase